MTLKEKKMLLYKIKRYPHRKTLLKVPERHTGYEIRANNFKRSGNKKSVVFLGESMTKLLNGWEMTKRIQSNCIIYGKISFRATVSCMEDYMKPSLRNPPDHFILHVGTKHLSPQKSSMEIIKSIINLAC